jgi:hypothetical protein
VKFQRRFANGFSFLNSYTYGSTTTLNDDNDGTVTLTNVYDPEYDRGPAGYDVKHTLASSWIYELPFGRNSKLGGWQLGSIVYLRSGLAVNVTQSQGVLSTGTGNRPNLIGDGYPEDKTIDQWLDPNDFQRTPDLTATYGDTPRNAFRGPGQFNIDLSLIKNTRFGRVNWELRVEAFNLLNHPQFANPNAQFGNAAFGRISAMLSNPACHSCGTIERNIQFATKISF